MFMAAMKFIVKFFPEITIKSRPVRNRFVRQLTANLRRLLSAIEPTVTVRRGWDKLTVEAPDDARTRPQLVNALSRVPGISRYLDVLEYPLGDMDDMLAHTLAAYAERLAGKTFAVRCKRSGRHDFNSMDVERYLGAGLLRSSGAAAVNLRQPEVVVYLEIKDRRLFVVNHRYPGLGGYPLGALDPVLSLISGGFDSTVATYLAMKRGMCAHLLFFRLGGRDHEAGVKRVALYLWQQFGSSHRVRFISVPFEEVVAELLDKVENSQMGVVLKRMMLRAATRIADDMQLDALLTGESVSQVSSQTLRNISVIDSVTDKLVLRPLIAANKEEIIRTAGQIGTADFAADMLEYCGVISINPTTRARPERIAVQEARFDMAVLERSIAAACIQNIDEMTIEPARNDIEVCSIPLTDSVIVDIRHPQEAQLQPLKVPGNTLNIPFYELRSRAAELDPAVTYMLYCGRGAMSAQHATILLAAGYENIKVYRPPARPGS